MAAVQAGISDPARDRGARALDIIVADEMHSCGSTMTALRRLGVEYLRTVSRAGSEQTIWWYRSLLEILDGAVGLAAARNAGRAAADERGHGAEPTTERGGAVSGVGRGRSSGRMLLAVAACGGGPPKPAPLNPVRFLLVNDVYVADTMADGSGGLARVATVRQRLADQGPISSCSRATS